MTRLLVILALATSAAHAQPVPAPLEGIGVDERIGNRIPRALTFDAVGLGPMALGDVLDGKRPVLLVLAYARCAMLCNLVLRGAARVAAAMSASPPEDYRLVLVGLDPRETADEAQRALSTLLALLGRGDDPRRWLYLRGDRLAIDAVADALGFRYRWDPRSEQYAHPAVLFVLTPDGRVSRYLHGLEFEPIVVETALADARAGRLVTAATAEVLRCFRFDPSTRTAGLRAELAMRICATLIFVMLLATVGSLIAWERRRRTS